MPSHSAAVVTTSTSRRRSEFSELENRHTFSAFSVSLSAPLTWPPWHREHGLGGEVRGASHAVDPFEHGLNVRRERGPVKLGCRGERPRFWSCRHTQSRARREGGAARRRPTRAE